MLDLNKIYEFFQPEKVRERIHIIGCGSVGSVIAENLARCGLKKITLWDFDKVEKHNIVNQMFRQKDVGRPKTEALKDILVEINDELEKTVKVENGGWQGKLLSGYVFLCMDNIDLRRDFVEKHFKSPTVKAVFDVRTELKSAQLRAADWSDTESKQDLLNSMQFSHEEAKAEETDVSACGITLGVATTVRLICGLAVNNFLNFVKGEGLKKLVLFDGFEFEFDAF